MSHHTADPGSLSDRIGRASRVPTWIGLGVSAGLATSLQVPFAVALVWARPDLQFGYPLVLLPLLLAGH